MSESLHEIIDLDRLGPNGAELNGSFPLSKMTRIQDICSEAKGDAQVAIELVRGKGSRLSAQGRVSACVKLTCQRCLDDFEVPLEAAVSLEIVKTMTSEHRDHDVYELDEEGQLALLALVEDELLLQLPSVPKHRDSDDCNQEMIGRATEYVPDEEAVEEDNPFAVLKQLKKT